MVVIGQELVPFFLTEAATLPFNLMGVGQAHLEGGKRVVKGDIIVPVSHDGAVNARCRDATIYIANVGLRCILGFPFFARYSIHIDIEPSCFMFEEDVGKVVTPKDLAVRTSASSSHLRGQPHEPESCAREASMAIGINDKQRHDIVTSGSCTTGDTGGVFDATSLSIPPALQLAVHAPIADGSLGPPMVLETPSHEVYPPPAVTHTAHFLSCVFALCTAGAAQHRVESGGYKFRPQYLQVKLYSFPIQEQYF